VRDTVDSLESALLAIRLSNMTLLHTPLSKDCQWPADFSKAPSQETLVKMGISGAVMSQGGSAAFERDPYTGLPRPTSPFYLLLKEKETLLKRTKRPRRNGHKNALRAFGVVSLNNKEVAELERELAYSEKGYKQCAGLVRSSDKTFSRGIKEDYCPSEARKHTKLDLIKENKDALKEDRDNAKKNYVPLAKKVNRIFLANLDYLGAALTQITGAILKMSSAINNVKNEFRRLPPREVAMLITRMENIKQIAPYFPQCISDNITIYKKLYSILRRNTMTSLMTMKKRRPNRLLKGFSQPKSHIKKYLNKSPPSTAARKCVSPKTSKRSGSGWLPFILRNHTKWIRTGKI